MAMDTKTQIMLEVLKVFGRALDARHPEWEEQHYVDPTYTVELLPTARAERRAPGFEIHLRRAGLPTLSARFECTTAWQELET